MAKEEQWHNEVPAGVVYAQSPPAGAVVPAGSTVSVTVSKGQKMVVVPNVVGMPEEKARRAILDAGLQEYRWGINYQGHQDLPEKELTRVCVGCVLSITPPGGTEVPPGTEIMMAVRKD